jgi:hypothetical protein
VWCGRVIGTYEPMTVLAEGEIRETSRLTDRTPLGDCYRGACLERAHPGAKDMDALGMTPTSRAKLGLDLVRAQSFDLARQWAEDDDG